MGHLQFYETFQMGLCAHVVFTNAMDSKINSTPIWPQKGLSSPSKIQDMFHIVENMQWLLIFFLMTVVLVIIALVDIVVVVVMVMLFIGDAILA